MLKREEAPAVNEGQSKDSLQSATSKVAPKADPEKVREFLTMIGGPWHLARTGLWAGRTFADLEDAVAAACTANDRGHCLYFLGNTPRGGALQGRRRKCDVESVRAVWLDIDDPDPDVWRELEDRLPWRPTYVAFTGGGWQAMWRLSHPTEPSDGEAIALWLQSEFADLTPDSTHSCEHIFRLPGTRNRKAGRHDRMCEVVGGDCSSEMPLAEAGRLEPKPIIEPVAIEFDDEFEFSDDDLWEILPPWALRLLASNVRDALTGEVYASRSEHEWAFIGACLRDGVPPLCVIRRCLLMPAGLGEETKVSHRSHWAKIKGRYIPRRNPALHAEHQIASYLAKEAIDG